MKIIFFISVLTSDVKRGQNLESEAEAEAEARATRPRPDYEVEAEAKTNYEKVRNNYEQHMI